MEEVEELVGEVAEMTDGPTTLEVFPVKVLQVKDGARAKCTLLEVNKHY